MSAAEGREATFLCAATRGLASVSCWLYISEGVRWGGCDREGRGKDARAPGASLWCAGGHAPACDVKAATQGQVQVQTGVVAWPLMRAGVVCLANCTA